MQDQNKTKRIKSLKQIVKFFKGKYGSSAQKPQSKSFLIDSVKKEGLEKEYLEDKDIT